MAYTVGRALLMAFNPALSARDMMDNAIREEYIRTIQSQKDKRGNWYDSPSVKRTLGITDKRLSCNYCGQQNTIENFDGGCKNCGAPAPRR